MAEDIDAEEQLIEEVASFAYDPGGFKRFAFPWGEPGTELEDSPGPRKWAQKKDEDLRKHLANPKTRYQPFLDATGSGHGIGKSADIGQTICWAMSCFNDAKVLWTANTLNQLLTKTNPEIAKWFRLCITSHWFQVNATNIHSKEEGHERTWRADSVTWSKHNTEAFAGLHNKGKIIVIIFDEASGIDDKVWEVTRGALTDENTIILWLAYGNITRATGEFREAFRNGEWNCRHIDSRDVEGTNKVQIEKWRKKYGENSDYFKVRVRGLPPVQSLKQFIGDDLVDTAMKVQLREEQYNFAPKIIVVDPAWEGDDLFEIGMRQGLRFDLLAEYPKNDDDTRMAKIIADFEDEHKCDAVFIDVGWGTGIYSIGKSWGRKWQLVSFGAGSPEEDEKEDEHYIGYFNMRAWMYGQAKQWLKDGGALPKNEELRRHLTQTETISRSDGKIQLESKADMKARGLPSPGKADLLAMSFAFPVKKKLAHEPTSNVAHKSTWNPLKRR